MREYLSVMNRMGSLLVAVSLTIFLSGCFKKREAFPLSDVANAPDHLSEDRLRFKGVPQLTLMGVYKWRTSTGPADKPGVGKRHQFRYVVPITNKAWNSSRPVSLWLSFSTSKENVNAEIGRLRRALSSGEIEGKVLDFPSRTTGVLRGVSAWQSAVDDACAKHGLKTDPRAPIVVWK